MPIFSNELTTKTCDASLMLGIESYLQEDNLVISRQKPNKVFAGRVYSMSTLSGGGAEFSNLISAIFKSAPDNSLMQFNLICAPNSEIQNKYAINKTSGNETLQQIVKTQSLLFEQFRNPRVQDLSDQESFNTLPDMTCLNELTLIVSFNIPVKSSELKDLKETLELQDDFLIGLKSCGFWDVEVLTPLEIIRVYRQFIDLNSTKTPLALDPSLCLNQQIFTSEDKLDFRDSKYLNLNDTWIVRAVSAKSLPLQVQDGLMNLIIGAPMNTGTVREGGGLRINTPFILSASVRLAQQTFESKRIERALTSRQNAQSVPQWLNFGQPVKSVVEDLKWISSACSDGVNKYVYSSFTCFLFGSSKLQVDASASNFRLTLNNLGFDARDVLINHGVRWSQSLPLNFSFQIANKLNNEALMPASSAACLLPIYGDYCGNADLKSKHSGSVFLTRRGRAYYFDPFISQTNKNGIIFAESGAGKSFLMQYIISNHLAEGATVFLFDNGKSAKKTCMALGGEFIEFSVENAAITSINPFTGLSSIEFNEQNENICDLLMKMCFYEEPMQPVSRIVMNEAIKAAFAQMQDYTEVEHVVQSLANIADNFDGSTHLSTESISAATSLRVRLNAFIKSPTRGPFFKGESNLDPQSPFTVIELSALDADPHLKQCVLFFVMNSIMNRVKSRSGRKLIFLDEAWQILKDASAASVVEGFFRKIRKDNGSIWVVTQSLDDLVGNPSGEVILSQSQWKLIMKQKPEVIDKNIHQGALARFSGDAFFVKSLKDIATVKGKYSELLILGDMTYESVRLYVPAFVSALFSSEGPERDEVFKLMGQGATAIEAVGLVINDLQRDRRRWLDAIVHKLISDQNIDEAEFIKEFRSVYRQAQEKKTL